MKKISDSTISRLSTYFRTLSSLIEKNVETVSSDEIADINSITSAQVRKDLSFFGTFGKRGLGYNTQDLKDEIASILGLKKQWKIALAGVGNIGKALINFNEFKTQGFHFTALFDSDPKKIGTTISSLTVHSIDDVCSVIKTNEIEIVIITVPTKMAQEVIDTFVQCGVRAFLNFAQVTIKVPDNVLVKNENMSIELEALSYYLTKNKN